MNPASAAPPAASPAPDAIPAPPKRPPDFSDRLSPMLVKELRQGMRSPVFIWGMIGMNLLLAIVVWLMVENAGDDDLTEAFWYAICGVVCVLLPMRAGNALSDELRGGTIDTLVLTRLNGWRITAGKWVAVAAQQALIMVTVLPYLIVRYFAGGINVLNELTWLGIFLTQGMVSAAVLTGFSWLRHFLLRAALVAGAAWAGGAFCVEIAEDLARGNLQENPLREMYDDIGGWGMAMLGTALVHACFFSLDVGASKVSAAVENRATFRRLFGLAALGLYAAGMITAFDPATGAMRDERMAIGAVLAMGTTALLAWQALSERPANFEPVVRPFVRLRRPGVLAGRLLYPGWPSGVCFTGLICLIAFIGFWIGLTDRQQYAVHFPEHYGRMRWQALSFLLAAVGSLPVPLVTYHLTLRRFLPWNGAVYLLMLGLTAAVQLVLLALCEASDNASWLFPGMLFPGMGFIAPEYVWHPDTPEFNKRTFPDQNFDWPMETVAWITAGAALLWWLAALWMARLALFQTRSVERRVREALRQEKAGKSAAPARDSAETT